MFWKIAKELIGLTVIALFVLTAAGIAFIIAGNAGLFRGI